MYSLLFLLLCQQPTIEVTPGFIVVEGKMPIKKEAAKSKDPFDQSNVRQPKSRSVNRSKSPAEVSRTTKATSARPVGERKTRTQRVVTTQTAPTTIPVLGVGRRGGTIVRCRT